MRDPAPDHVLGRLSRQAGWLLGANILALGVAFAQGILLARNLGPAAFGSLALMLALTDLIQQLLSSRVWETATTFVTRYRATGDTRAAAAVLKICLSVDLIAATASTLLLLASAEFLARWFIKDPGAVGALRACAVMPILLVPIATGRSMLRMADRYRWLSSELLAESMVRLIAVWIVLALVGTELGPVVTAYLIAAGVGSVAMVWLMTRAWRELGLGAWRDSPLSAVPQPRQVLRFMLYSNLSGTFRLLSAKADLLMLGWFVQPAAVGVYRLARSLADPLVALSDPVYQATYPELARLIHEGATADARRLTDSIRRRAWLVIVPACMLVTLLAGWVIPLVFGTAYTSAVPLVQLLVWQLVWIPYLWVPGLLLSMGKAGIVASLTGVDAVIYVAMLLVLVPTMGVTGAALATVLRFLIWAVAAAELGRRANHELVTVVSA